MGWRSAVGRRGTLKRKDARRVRAFATDPSSESGQGPDRTSSEQQSRILLVDDDADMRSLLADVLSDDGYQVVEAENGAEALLYVHRGAFDAILLDKNMPGLSGMDLLPGLRTICPQTPVIIITAFGDAHLAAEGEAKGACACLFKPFRMDELDAALHRALSQQECSIGTEARPNEGGHPALAS